MDELEAGFDTASTIVSRSMRNGGEVSREFSSVEIEGSFDSLFHHPKKLGRQRSGLLSELGPIECRHRWQTAKLVFANPATPPGISMTVNLRLPCDAEVDRGTTIADFQAGAWLKPS
jgi:hypothetical protein